MVADGDELELFQDPWWAVQDVFSQASCKFCLPLMLQLAVRDKLVSAIGCVVDRGWNCDMTSRDEILVAATCVPCDCPSGQ